MDAEYIYVPLKFWFCDTTKPLPIIALQNSEIYIDVKFRDFYDCVSVLEQYGGNLYHSDKKHQLFNIEDVSLQANFYLVEHEERKNLASREYNLLITQTQIRSTYLTSSATLDINFNHVVKDLLFFIQPVKNQQNGEYFNFTAKTKSIPKELYLIMDSNALQLWNLEPFRHLLTQARILFNGIERVGWRDPKYFYLAQNHENYRNMLYTYIYMYSFNINPTLNNNWSGCNFSRLENPQLQVNMKPNPFIISNSPLITYPIDSNYQLVCYATNYNILVIKGGMAGLKYNN